MSVTVVNESSPKLEQFVKELNTLMDRYQYDMVAMLDYKTNGVLPVIRMVDVPPATEETPAPETPPEESVKEQPNLEAIAEAQDGGTPNGQ